MAVELFAEVLEAPRTRLVVLARREGLVPTMSITVLVHLLEHLVAGLLGMGLGPLVVRLDAAELLLEVSHDGAVGEFLLELVCRQLEAPGCDLVGPPVRLVRAVNQLHLGNHVLHDDDLGGRFLEVQLLRLAEAQ